jgi:hypothetical protein
VELWATSLRRPCVARLSRPFGPENGQSLLSLLPPDLRLATVPDEDWLVEPPTSAAFGLKRPLVIVWGCAVKVPSRVIMPWGGLLHWVGG